MIKKLKGSTISLSLESDDPVNPNKYYGKVTMLPSGDVILYREHEYDFLWFRGDEPDEHWIEVVELKVIMNAQNMPATPEVKEAIPYSPKEDTGYYTAGYLRTLDGYTAEHNALPPLNIVFEKLK